MKHLNDDNDRMYFGMAQRTEASAQKYLPLSKEREHGSGQLRLLGHKNSPGMWILPMSWLRNSFYVASILSILCNG